MSKNIKVFNLVDGTTIMGKIISDESGIVVIKNPVKALKHPYGEAVIFLRYDILNGDSSSKVSFNTSNIISFYDPDPEVIKHYKEASEKFEKDHSPSFKRVPMEEIANRLLKSSSSEDKVDDNDFDIDELRKTVKRLDE